MQKAPYRGPTVQTQSLLLLCIMYQNNKHQNLTMEQLEPDNICSLKKTKTIS